MNGSENEVAVLNRLVRWAEEQALIRAMLLYSSRANPEAPVDRFSDYDVFLAVIDIHQFFDNDRWLEDFGEILVVFRNPIGLDAGFECFGFITHYQEGVKIDYGFYPVEYLSWAAEEPKLPDDLDNGYIVLLDKDHLTDGLMPPTFSAFQPSPPTNREYQAIIDEFFNDAIYVAKHLWRDNLFPVKLSLDHIMKFHCVRRMLEWQMGIENHWSIKPGANAKGLKHWIAPEIWVELENTYVGAGIDENWEALFRTINLFRKVAQEVAQNLGYQYPNEMDQRVMVYLEEIKDF